MTEIQGVSEVRMVCDNNAQKTVVTVVNESTRFWLKGTTWSFSLDRADRFDTTEQAFAAIAKARKFHKAKVMNRAELWSEDMAVKEMASEVLVNSPCTCGYDPTKDRYEAHKAGCPKG